MNAFLEKIIHTKSNKLQENWKPTEAHLPFVIY